MRAHRARAVFGDGLLADPSDLALGHEELLLQLARSFGREITLLRSGSCLGPRALEQAGAFAIVLEAIPPDLAARVTDEVTIPTIGIGAGSACDGQVLVFSSGGATFEKHELPGESAWDVADGRVLLTSDAGDMTIASLDAQAAAAPVTVPKKGRLGLRLVAEGSLLRVLSRGADPAEGARMMLHRSEDAGRSWLHANLAVSSRCDIAGPSSGIGADVAGGLYVPRQ